MPIIPADAMEKANEKVATKDFYADLSAEEREAEGLPAAEPAKEPAPVVTPAKKEEPAAEPEEDEDEITSEAVLAEIAKLREDLGAALGGPGPNADAEQAIGDALLKAGLEHDDPVVRGLAQRTQDMQQRQVAAETRERAQAQERQLLKDDADFEAVQKAYAIGGVAMTDAQVEQVEKYMLKNPEVGSRLSIEQVTRVVFPDAVRVGTKGAPPVPPAKGAAPETTQPVATIVDTGTAGGAAPEPWKPKPNDDMQSAIQAAGRKFGWVR